MTVLGNILVRTDKLTYPMYASGERKRSCSSKLLFGCLIKTIIMKFFVIME